MGVMILANPPSALAMPKNTPCRSVEYQDANLPSWFHDKLVSRSYPNPCTEVIGIHMAVLTPDGCYDPGNSTQCISNA